MGIDIEFVNLSLKDRSLLLGALYRQSLIHIGMSPDTHVFDIDYDYLSSKGSIQAKFLMDIIDFYLELDDFQSKIFISQVLEHGRYYPFWWMNYLKKEDDYKRLYIETLKRVDSHFRAA